MSLKRLRFAWWSRLLPSDNGQSRILATAMTVAVVAYLAWKITESPDQAVQFAFNGLAVGAIYALLAMGFTIVYSTVWFFDLYYGAAAAIGAYGVFYLRSQDGFGGNDYTNPYVNAMLAAVTAGVVAWALYEAFFHKLRPRFDRRVLYAVGGILAVGAGGYMGLVLSFTDDTHVILSPAIGFLVAFIAGWALFRGARLALPTPRATPFLIMAGIVGVALGGYCAFLIANAPGSNLYVSWGVSCLMAGIVAVAFYRGLYVYMRERARSPLIMLVATLGILLAITAATSIIFESNPRPLPEAFGSAPWTILGSNIKGFNVFTIGVAIVGFAFLLFLLRMTSFGKAVRAIGDDEEVSKVVGINTTVIIAIVFFIGAVFAAMAGLLSGHDTAIQPRMGLLLLLKGWIASVVGGIGNLYGAIVGGFALGMIEQFGIWDLAGEWKDVISFMVLILFLSFWPKGLLPRE
ncbi:MAG: hypothetical protein F4Y50_13185 [Dehalococcoidia bacterium]|nr:hypothetical protein [Dehalococcoidia bacterium]